MTNQSTNSAKTNQRTSTLDESFNEINTQIQHITEQMEQINAQQEAFLTFLKRSA